MKLSRLKAVEKARGVMNREQYGVEWRWMGAETSQEVFMLR
jgi:hypothetical protein